MKEDKRDYVIVCGRVEVNVHGLSGSFVGSCKKVLAIRFHDRKIRVFRPLISKLPGSFLDSECGTSITLFKTSARLLDIKYISVFLVIFSWV